MVEGELHPLNNGFEWKRLRGPYRLLTSSLARQFDVLGYFVLRGAIPPEQIAALTAEIDQFELQAQRLLRSLPQDSAFVARSDALTFTSHLVKKSAAARQLCSSRLFRDIAADVIGPDVRLYWDHAVYKKPHSGSAFGWHQDNGYTFVEPQQYITCWIALTDADERNGCLWVAPGGHKRGTLRHTQYADGYYCFDTMPPGAVSVPAAAGDIVIFSAVMPHCTGVNDTESVRKAYILQFIPDGAYAIVEDGNGGYRRRAAVTPDRQFEVLVGGRRPA